jgi:hypothetical protein
MGGFFFKFFNKEPCSDVKEPEGDGTVKNSWGLIKDITRSMVNTYGWGIVRQDITFDDMEDIQEFYEFLPWQTRGPEPPSFTSSDDYLVFFNVMWDSIPAADPTYHYQYGFVFDRDGDTENNYEPHPSYPYDFFQDTDYWIVASYDPTAGWTVAATDARNSAPTTVDSDAEIILVGNTLILMVPRDEFLADNIGYRMSAYKHPGDWGWGSGDWDGDVQPPVADGLKWIDIGSY